MSTTLEIGTLYNSQREKLGLCWISGEHLQNQIAHSSEDSPSEISIVGHLNLINPHRVQVLGRQELEYLENLKKNSRKDTITRLFSGQSTVVIIANELAAPDDLVSAAEASRIPVLSAKLPSEETINNLQYYLGNYFAKKITLHGVFMEVIGTGNPVSVKVNLPSNY